MASPSAAPRHVVVKFLAQTSQQPCVCFVAHVPGGVRHETRGVSPFVGRGDGLITFCLECEGWSIEAEWLIEQREVGRLGEWRAGGGHLDLAALPAAAAALPRRRGVLSLGSIVQGRLLAWLLLHGPRAVSQSWWCVCDTAWDSDVLGCMVT